MRTLGRYELLRPLARGGMAEVYLARRRVAGVEKRLVIKRLRRERTADPRFLDLFVKEAQLSMSLVQQNIVPVFDFGRAGDDVFLAMEHIDGKDLGSSLDRAGGAMPPLVAAFVAAECCHALHYAHRGAGGGSVVHRDVTPRNVLLSWAGEVKLADFGIAAAMGGGEGALAGTPSYMAPEQARGESLDGRADLYSLGLILWEMLIGARARPGAERGELLEAARRNLLPPLPEGLAPELVEVLRAATAATPAERLPSAQAMSDLLDAFMVAERARTAGAPPARQLASWLAARWDDAPGARGAAAGGDVQLAVDGELSPLAALEDGDDFAASGTPAVAAPTVTFLDDGAAGVLGSATMRSMAVTAPPERAAEGAAPERTAAAPEVEAAALAPAGAASPSAPLSPAPTAASPSSSYSSSSPAPSSSSSSSLSSSAPSSPSSSSLSLTSPPLTSPSSPSPPTDASTLESTSSLESPRSAALAAEPPRRAGRGRAFAAASLLAVTLASLGAVLAYRTLFAPDDAPTTLAATAARSSTEAALLSPSSSPVASPSPSSSAPLPPSATPSASSASSSATPSASSASSSATPSPSPAPSPASSTAPSPSSPSTSTPSPPAPSAPLPSPPTSTPASPPASSPAPAPASSPSPAPAPSSSSSSSSPSSPPPARSSPGPGGQRRPPPAASPPRPAAAPSPSPAAPAAAAAPRRAFTIGARPWAHFTIDGDAQRYETPATVELTLGTHRVRFENPALGITEEVTLTVTADGPASYLQKLQ